MQKIYTSLLLTLLVMLGLAGTASAQTLAIDIADVTAGNARVTVTPSADSIKYYCGAYTTAEFDQYAAEEGGIIGRHINNWKNMSQWYGEEWTVTMSYMLQSGVYSSGLASIYGAAVTPETEYVVYAFGMTADGQVSVPLTSAKVTTAAKKVSTNTFDINVKKVWVSSAPDAAVRLSANVVITPSNSDTYAVACLESKYLTQYDLTDSVSLAKLAKDQVCPYAYNYYTTVCDTTFTAMRKDKEFYVIAVGIEDGVATTLPTLTLFRTEVPKPVFTLAVSDVTCIDAHIEVVPANPDQKYQWGIIRQSVVDEMCGGDVQAIHERDIAWWEFLAGMYPGSTWNEFALQFHTTGTVQGSYREVMGDNGELGTPLDWDAVHYLYAYTIDDEGNKNSDIYTVQFTTLPREVVETNFNIQVSDIKADPNRDGKLKATIHVTPEDPSMTYAINCFDAKYYDFYVDNPNYTMEDYWMHQVYETLQGPFEGERDFNYGGLTEGKAYVFNVMGIDEIPVTECFVLRFEAQLQNAIADTEAEAFAVTAVAGGIQLTGTYTSAAVYTVDGRLAAQLNGQTSQTLPAGIYMVKAQTPAGEQVVKVAVQ